MIGDNDWIAQALCRREGRPSDWDDTLDLSSEDKIEPKADRADRKARAKAVCSRCPVRLTCEAKCDLERDSGIWFGLDLEEHRAGRATRRLVASENYTLLKGAWTA